MKNTERKPNRENRIISRCVLWGVFAIYCGVLVWMLFLSRSFRRGYSFSEYINAFSNFIPFNTVFHYAKIATLGSLEFIKLSLWNVMGNLVMLLPLGIFIPCLFRGIDRLWKVVITVTGVVVLIELAQLLFRVGVIDVDDLILNLSGAMIGYSLLKIPPISRALRAIDILPPQRIREKKSKKAKEIEKTEKVKERQYTLK